MGSRPAVPLYWHHLGQRIEALKRCYVFPPWAHGFRQLSTQVGHWLIREAILGADVQRRPVPKGMRLILVDYETSF
jgi:hypothetical protein